MKPAELPESPEHRKIVSEFYNTYASRSWFIKAEFDGNQFDIHATVKPTYFESIETLLMIKKIHVVRWVIKNL